MSLVDLSEFRDFGHLQEVNRAYFHPRGMALTLVTHDDGRQELQVQIDPDPEGWTFDWIDDPEGARQKAGRVARQLEERRPAREAAIGNWQQPLPRLSTP